jgi:hypothetical protein
MAYIILKSNCPYCSSINCYNSGFTVECVNVACKFYNKKHHEAIQKEIAVLREKDREKNAKETATEQAKNKVAEQTHNSIEEDYDDYDADMLAAYGYPGYKIV